MKMEDFNLSFKVNAIKAWQDFIFLSFGMTFLVAISTVILLKGDLTGHPLSYSQALTIIIFSLVVVVGAYFGSISLIRALNKRPVLYADRSGISICLYPLKMPLKRWSEIEKVIFKSFHVDDAVLAKAHSIEVHLTKPRKIYKLNLDWLNLAVNSDKDYEEIINNIINSLNKLSNEQCTIIWPKASD